VTIICLLFFVSLPIDIFRARVVLFNATFNSISVISWRLVLFDEETGIPGQNHRPPVCHWQTLSHCCIEHSSSWAGFELTTLVDIGTYCIDRYTSKYHTITTAPTTSSSSVIMFKAHLQIETFVSFVHYIYHY
jgi:hypothetical protein